MNSRFVTLNGQPFFLRSWGDPSLPTLLMLHGFPEYGDAWADLALHLAPHYHCVAPDHRGYGQSWVPESVGHYTLSNLVSDMAALIETQGGPVTVLGHDWGASVAYGLAMFRPELVDRLIIANGVHPVPFQRAMAAGGPQSAASQYINDLRAEDAADRFSANNFALLERFFRYGMGLDWLSDHQMQDYRTEWARPGRLNAMLNWYRASPLVVAKPGEPLTDLPEFPVERLMVRCPHLLLWGPEDKALLPEATSGLETFAPDLKRVDIPGADHWLHHQRPDAMAQAILDWSGA
ncbi:MULTISPECIES: alpha/beta hydrolase [unclassified Ruegeria]|uniref:alpha/beta fold hydrolase n=1 Tax=unclassified Ruegeria TaxID=2625375 RepID=UPI001ADC9771|nr:MULTISPECIES: alpha/beta hydrolase [unclassified Ruegeria]MBO9410265.1 alpha/beta hydrolase [Ruegeria sp. R8_1]MBO9414516.1 alpha/beta hydrolase [Ruegeria sp. R8_2]